MKRPQLSPHLSVRAVPGDGSYLFSETGVSALRGPIYMNLIPLLDGGRTVAELVEQLSGTASPAEVHLALRRLSTAGHVVEAFTPQDAAALAATTIRGRQPAPTPRFLVEAIGTPGAEADDPRALEFAALLVSLGAATSTKRTQGRPGTIAVIITDDATHDDVSARLNAHLGQGRPAVPLVMDASRVWCGPLLRPQSRPCWECVSMRLLGAQPHLALLDRGRRQRRGRNAVPSHVTHLAAAVIAHATSNWQSEDDAAILDSLLAWDVRTASHSRHRIMAHPDCPTCGRPPFLPVPQPFRLGPSNADRGTARQLLESKVHLVSSLAGVVTRLDRANLEVDEPIHLYQSAYAVPPPHGLSEYRNALRRTCVGKGPTEDQAKAGALGEAIERYSATFTGLEAMTRATLNELGDGALDPRECLLFSNRQYEQRHRWRPGDGYFSRVPPPFRAHIPIDWVTGRSLTHNKTRYVPAGLVFLGHREQPGVIPETSNGLAAGTTPNDALLAALLELVERDAASIWWYHRLRRPGVDLAAFGDPYLSRVAQMLQEAGRDLQVLDLTHDLNIPVLVAISQRTEAQAANTVLGFGCHPDPAAAIVKAVSEMTQMLGWLGMPGPHETVPYDDLATEAASWISQTDPKRQPHLQPDFSQTSPIPSDRRQTPPPPPQLLNRVLESLGSAGLEVIALDLTRPDTELPVVRAIVPGLRPLWPRFAPGRLYHVPAKLGWINQANDETTLNPAPAFL